MMFGKGDAECKHGRYEPKGDVATPLGIVENDSRGAECKHGRDESRGDVAAHLSGNSNAYLYTAAPTTTSTAAIHSSTHGMVGDDSASVASAQLYHGRQYHPHQHPDHGCVAGIAWLFELPNNMPY